MYINMCVLAQPGRGGGGGGGHNLCVFMCVQCVDMHCVGVFRATSHRHSESVLANGICGKMMCTM